MPKTDLIYLFYCRADKRKKLTAEVTKKFPQIKLINIHCAGRFNPVIAFNLMMKENVKGIVLLGCDSGDCHYREGNLFSERRLFLAQETLNTFGLDGSCLQVLWYNPSKINAVMKELEIFVNRIENLSKEGVSNGR
jgi:F420-non-reducing hydrogenase iron-sulfur subunit